MTLIGIVLIVLAIEAGLMFCVMVLHQRLKDIEREPKWFKYVKKDPP